MLKRLFISHWDGRCSGGYGYISNFRWCHCIWCHTKLPFSSTYRRWLLSLFAVTNEYYCPDLQLRTPLLLENLEAITSSLGLFALLKWLVLSDEQMSNKMWVEQQPVKIQVFLPPKPRFCPPRSAVRPSTLFQSVRQFMNYLTADDVWRNLSKTVSGAAFFCSENFNQNSQKTMVCC